MTTDELPQEYCLVISRRPEDVEFARKVAATAGLRFMKGGAVEDIREHLTSHPGTVVLWDIDHPDSILRDDPQSFQIIAQMLVSAIPAERVFGISDDLLNTIPHVFNIPAFGHHLLRRFQNPAAEIIAQLARATFLADPFETLNYVKTSTIQRIEVKRSTHRHIAAEAISNILEKRGTHPRLISLAAQAVDELVMNAIFNAPVKPGGAPYRRDTDRAEDFHLASHETVTIALGDMPEYMAIAVSDQFGSLGKSTILSFIRKDYQRLNYKLKSGETGAGLGIYGMIQSGLSLLFLSRPGQQTKVILFLPHLRHFKDFRTSFRFFSFMTRD